MDDWKAIAAIWGAVLSTILALSKLFHPRPIVTISMVRSPAMSADLELTVINPGKYPVMLRSISSRGAPIHWQTGSILGWETIDVVSHALYKELNVVLEPEATFKLTATFVNEPKDQYLAMIVRFRSHRFVAWPMFPTIIFRTAKDLFKLSQHPRNVKLS